MPRSVNISPALAALGQRQAAAQRQANLELQRRELERQEMASIGALGGSIAGAALAPPGMQAQGAQIGGLLGTRLAGGSTTPAQATYAGMSLGQIMQPTQAEQQQSAYRELYNAEQQQTQPLGTPVEQQQTQPLGTPVEQQQTEAPLVAEPMLEGPPPPLVGPQRPVAAIPMQVPTQDRPLAPQGLQVPKERQPTHEIRLSPMERRIAKTESDLKNAESVLQNRDLSPNAFQIQQNRVLSLRNRLQKQQDDFLQLQEKRITQLSKVERGPKLFTIRQDGDVLSTGLTADEARDVIRNIPANARQGVILEEVGKPLQKRRIEGVQTAFGETLNRLYEAQSPQEVQEIMENTDFSKMRSFDSSRLARLAGERVGRLQQKESGKAEKEIKDLDIKDAYTTLDKKLEEGNIDFKQKDKIEKQLIKREQRELKLAKRKAYKEKEIKSISTKSQLVDIFSTMKDNVDEFGSITGEQAIRGAGAFIKEKLIGQTSSRTKVKKALARLQLILSSDEITGVLSDQDIKFFREGMPALDSPQDFVEDYLDKATSRLRQSWEIEKGSYRNLGRDLQLEAINKLDQKLGITPQETPGRSVQFQPGKSYRVGDRVYTPKNQSEFNAISNAAGR